MIKFKTMNPEIINVNSFTEDVERNLSLSLIENPRDIYINVEKGAVNEFMFFARQLPKPYCVDVPKKDNEDQLLYYKKWVCDLYENTISIDLDKEMIDDEVFDTYSGVIGHSKKTAIIKTPSQIFLIFNIIKDGQLIPVISSSPNSRLAELRLLSHISKIRDEAVKNYSKNGVDSVAHMLV